MRPEPTASKIVVPAFAASHPAWLRLADQLDWFEKKSASCQARYKRWKIVQISLAVAIPVSALLPAEYAKWLSAIAGSVIALVEALQQLNKDATLWIAYRSTAESLKREQALFLSAAGSYRDKSEGERLVQLAEHVEDMLSAENSQWGRSWQKSATPPGHAAGSVALAAEADENQA